MLENILLYSSPTVPLMIGIILIGALFLLFCRMFDRNYTEVAEDYFNRNYLD